MSARLDKSDYTTVIWCDECPEWSEFAYNRGPAHDIAVAHERSSHPGCRRAYMNRAKYRERLRV